MIISSKENYFMYDYVNPILKLRKEQQKALKMNDNLITEAEIFYSIPKNFRRIFMYDNDYLKAKERCGNLFNKRLKSCIEYCLEVIG